MKYGKARARLFAVISLLIFSGITFSGCLSTEGNVFDASVEAGTSKSIAVEPIASPMIIVPGLDEPLVATKATSKQEDRAIERAVAKFRAYDPTSAESDIGYLAPFEQFVADHPHSGWTASVLTDLGFAYYRTGYFSRAFDAFEGAWQEGREAKDPMPKAIVDRAVGELARMHARVGHADELEALFADIGDRPLTGPATETITGAHEGAWEMRNNPGNAFLCGPKALGNVLRALGTSPKAVALLDQARSGVRGFTLRQVARLADSAGLTHRLIYRAPGQAIPVPSVVNWKVNHYAAIVSEENGRYHVQDPTFGQELVVSRAAIDAEASGYFLVPSGTPDDSMWQDATPEEAEAVYGMGNTSSNQAGAVTQDDTTTGDCNNPGLGMCVPNVHAMNVSLNLNDTPVGYAPQKGPPVYIRLSYNQRDVGPPGAMTYFNVGQKWTLNVLSFVQDMPDTPGSGVLRYVDGGGSRTYTGYSTTTGSFTPEQQTGAVLTRTPTTGTATSYTLNRNDGSRLVYGQSDTAVMGVRRMFLTAIVDPQGRSLSLTYDSTLRLTSITDAAGRVTTLSYGLSGTPLLVTAITDPFGRSASLTYNASGYLASITDVIGIVSQFDYNENGWVYRLTTPYGATNFTFSDPNDPFPNRSLEITDPMLFTERIEFMHGAPGVPQTETLTPTGMNINNGLLHNRNTFYWDKHVYPTYGTGAGKDYTKAKLWHWLHNAANQTSPIAESTKEPLESRVWYNYPGQPSGPLGPVYDGTSSAPTAMGRIVQGTTTQLSQAQYNSIGKPTYVRDPVGRTTTFQYASNNIDLLTVQQEIFPDFFNVAAYTYNSKHQPLTVTDAAGETWQYTYSPADEDWSVRDPLNNDTLFNYDTYGRLQTVVNENNATILSLTYPCDTPSLQMNCDLPSTVIDEGGRATNYVRDALDRVTVVTYPDGSTDQYSYTHLDRTSSMDRLGRITTYQYDANRRLTSVTNPLSHIVAYGYFRNGVLNTLTNENGVVTTWAIDVQSRPTSKTFAPGNVTTYAYEPGSGLLTTVTDALGQAKTIGYYKDNTVASFSYVGEVNPTPNVTFTYDSSFLRLKTMVDGNGTTNWSYVPIGTKGALSVLTENGALTSDDVTYGYDDLGRVVSMTVGSFPAETWHYDSIGRADIHTTSLGTFSYLFNGQTSDPIRRTLAGSNKIRTWTYDTNYNDRRLIGISDGVRTFTLGYGRWDATGQNPYHVTTLHQTGGGLPTQLSCYQYDNADRLLNVGTPTSPTGNCSQTQTSLYAYTPDAAGNLTTFTSATGVTNPTYNALNQITTNGTQNFSFDATGNETSNGAWVYRWDAENRLIDLVSGSKRKLFFYDGLGRIKRVLDWSDGGGPERRFVWCGSTLCGATGYPDAARYFPEGHYHSSTLTKWVTMTDHLGSVRSVTSGTGSALGSFDYTPYGELSATTGSAAPDFMYGQLFLDRNLGFYHSKTRRYDPRIGRWLSRDPIEEAGGINLYAYVDGDPLNRIDPTGEVAWVPAAGALVGAGASLYSNWDRDDMTNGQKAAAALFAAGTGALAAMPAGIWGSAFASAGGGFANNLFNQAQVSCRKLDYTSAGLSAAAGGFAGGLAGALGAVGKGAFRPSAVIGEPIPIPRHNFSSHGGIVGNAAGTAAGTYFGY